MKLLYFDKIIGIQNEKNIVYCVIKQINNNYKYNSVLYYITVYYNIHILYN